MAMDKVGMIRDEIVRLIRENTKTDVCGDTFLVSCDKTVDVLNGLLKFTDSLIENTNVGGKYDETLAKFKEKVEGMTDKEINGWFPETEGTRFRVGDVIHRKHPGEYDRDMRVARIEADYYLCDVIGKFCSEMIYFSEEHDYELATINMMEI